MAFIQIEFLRKHVARNSPPITISLHTTYIYILQVHAVRLYISQRVCLSVKKQSMLFK